MDPVDINESPVDGRLHFFVSDPEWITITRCASWQHHYDPELDAVFIDRRLFKGADLPKIAGAWPAMFFRSEDYAFAFSRTFATLVLLHELGHRELHRRGLVFDTAWRTGREETFEQEADDFAIDRLRRAR